MGSPDSLGAASDFKVYTTDGATDLDLIADGGSACRQIKILGAKAGNLIVTRAKQGGGDVTIPLDSLPAGDVLNVQATKIKGSSVSGLPLLVLWCFFALVLAGCATARDAAVVTLDGSAAFAASAEPALEELDRRDQEAIVDATFSESEAKAQLAVVRARYHKAWQAYRDFRASWLAAAAAVRAYDDASAAKLSSSEADFVKAVAALVDAERALVKATAVIRDGSGGPAAPSVSTSSSSSPPKPPAPPSAPAPSAAPAAPKPSGGAS